jgi:hypothetical protein
MEPAIELTGTKFIRLLPRKSKAKPSNRQRNGPRLASSSDFPATHHHYDTALGLLAEASARCIQTVSRSTLFPIEVNDSDRLRYPKWHALQSRLPRAVTSH